MTFAETLTDFKTRHSMTLPQLAELVGTKSRALEYWTAKTNPKEPRALAKRSVLATQKAYDAKHRPKAPKPTETAETTA